MSGRADATGTGKAEDGLPRATPEAVGMSSAAILALLDEAEACGVELNSLMIHRGGHVAAEGWWWPYRADRVHMLHSSSKAFTATAIGLAVSEGRLALTDPVLSFFPDHAPPEVSPNLAAMTVEHLLTQTCGHAAGISGAKWRSIETSWIAEFLKVPVPHAPGTHFAYSSATSFMLSAIISRVTGGSLHDYLKPRLLEPLGISGLRWDVGPEGVNPGGNGVSATTADFLKLIALHRADGCWHGRQVLPPGWAAQATTSRFGNPYGYHWWVAPEGLGYFAAGMFGQYGFVIPGLDLVIVTTAAIPDSTGSAGQAAWRLITGAEAQPGARVSSLKVLPPLIWKHAQAMCARGSDRGAAAALAERLQGLRLLPPVASAGSPAAAGLSGRRFVADGSLDGVTAITLHLSDTEGRLTVDTGPTRHEVRFGLGHWLESDTTLPGHGLHHGYDPKTLRVVASGAWTDPATLQLTCQFVETSFRDTITLRFDGPSLAYDRSVNVNTSDLRRPTICARE
jgi:CubicO group peptidase (beta-lactamase class C family)